MSDEQNQAKSPKKSRHLTAILVLFIAVLLIGFGLKLKQADKSSDLPPQPVVASAIDGHVHDEGSAAGALNQAADMTSDMHARNQIKETEFKPVMPVKGRVIGKDDAPVKIIEFASLTCSHCAHFHNVVLDEFRVKFVDTGMVQIEFRDFPLNKPAFDASRIVSCMPKDQQFPVMSMLFQTQSHWAFSSDYLTALRQNAKLAGMSDTEFDKCLADKNAETKFLDEIKADAEKYKIESTPSFIVNDGAGKITGALPVAEFEKQLAPYFSSTSAPAADHAPKTDSK